MKYPDVFGFTALKYIDERTDNKMWDRANLISAV